MSITDELRGWVIEEFREHDNEWQALSAIADRIDKEHDDYKSKSVLLPLDKNGELIRPWTKIRYSDEEPGIRHSARLHLRTSGKHEVSPETEVWEVYFHDGGTTADKDFTYMRCVKGGERSEFLELYHKPEQDTQEKIDADAIKTACEYFNKHDTACSKCPQSKGLECGHLEQAVSCLLKYSHAVLIASASIFS
jgi:hypothetical protein